MNEGEYAMMVGSYFSGLNSWGDNDVVTITKISFEEVISVNELSYVRNYGANSLYYTSVGKYVHYNGSRWVDDAGYTPAKSSGTTSSRPTMTADDAGFTYWDTDLGKMIAWSGTAWVNMDGTALS